jgi:GlpG protein
MRLIGTLKNENEARRFINYLTSQGVGSNCEIAFDPLSGHMSYHIWIHEEDKISSASADFEEFQRRPSDAKFEASEPEPEIPEEIEELPLRPEPHRYKSHLTSFILVICAFLFFLNSMEETSLPQKAEPLLTPLQAKLMYDLPLAFEAAEQNNLSPEAIAQLESASQAPYFRGGYAWVVHKIKGEDPSKGEGSLFIRLRQGEIWRLISPVVLHSDFLHILFNMLWLWYLGRPIEQRIGPFRTLLLSIVAGVGSNTIQYLMTGPFFIGYSGIVTALAGFIWMRERKAPWEGYPLNKSTILFLLFFIGAIFVIQAVSFFIQIFSHYNFAPNIANTAHIAGALIGAFFGRFSYFAQRIKK